MFRERMREDIGMKKYFDPFKEWEDALTSGEANPEEAALWLSIERETENCFPILKARMSEGDRRGFANTPMHMQEMYHHGLGTWIRNNLLKPDALLYQLFCEAGITHPDDMSKYIINRFHHLLQCGMDGLTHPYSKEE